MKMTMYRFKDGYYFATVGKLTRTEIVKLEKEHGKCWHIEEM